MYLNKQPPDSADAGQNDEWAARSAMREVHRTLNEFRSDQWAGLIRQRNLLMDTVTVAGIAAFALLGLIMFMGAPQQAIGTATVFFLVGAAVGLLALLNAARNTNTAVDDYGLATARLITTPLFSGLAAVFGVLLAVTLYGAVLSQTTTTTPSASISAATVTAAATPSVSTTATPATPAAQSAATPATSATASPTATASATPTPSTTAPTTETSVRSVPPPGDVYDIARDPLGLVIAAIFGLAPNLLLSGLQQQADKYRNALSSSQASSGNVN
jgi:hypothetical protein